MLAIRNVRIETIKDGRIDNATILIKGGKILSLGMDIDLSDCKKIIDGKNRVVTPGIIDSHTHLGLSESGVGREGIDTNEGTNPLTPYLSVRDGINMKDQAFDRFRKSGTTTVGVLPGSGNIIGGTGLALKCKGTIVDEAVVKDPIGMKAALGENPKGNYGNKKRSPSTRMGNASVLREALLKAKQCMYKLDESTQNISEADEDKESIALISVIKRKIPLIIHCHRHDDIVTAIRICKEFNIKYILDHVTDGYLVKDIIKKERIHCGVGPTLNYGSKLENRNRDFKTPIIFNREDIPFCFITDHPVIDGRNLVLTASIATQWGMTDEDALRAITLSAAEHIGIEDRVGSLEVGKDADIVLWSGNPLEFTSFVDMTIIDGDIVYERKGK